MGVAARVERSLREAAARAAGQVDRVRCARIPGQGEGGRGSLLQELSHAADSASDLSDRSCGRWSRPLRRRRRAWSGTAVRPRPGMRPSSSACAPSTRWSWTHCALGTARSSRTQRGAARRRRRAFGAWRARCVSLGPVPRGFLVVSRLPGRLRGPERQRNGESGRLTSAVRTQAEVEPPVGLPGAQPDAYGAFLGYIDDFYADTLRLTRSA